MRAAPVRAGEPRHIRQRVCYALQPSPARPASPRSPQNPPPLHPASPCVVALTSEQETSDCFRTAGWPPVLQRTLCMCDSAAQPCYSFKVGKLMGQRCSPHPWHRMITPRPHSSATTAKQAPANCASTPLQHMKGTSWALVLLTSGEDSLQPHRGLRPAQACWQPLHLIYA